MIRTLLSPLPKQKKKEYAEFNYLNYIHQIFLKIQFFIDLPTSFILKKSKNDINHRITINKIE